MIDTDDLRIRYSKEEKYSPLQHFITKDAFEDDEFDEYFSDEYVLWLETQLLELLNLREKKLKRILDE